MSQRVLVRLTERHLVFGKLHSNVGSLRVYDVDSAPFTIDELRKKWSNREGGARPASGRDYAWSVGEAEPVGGGSAEGEQGSVDARVEAEAD